MTPHGQIKLAAILPNAKTSAILIIRALASLKLAVCLIVVLAAVIAVATILETKHGRQYSQWFVYHSAWFIGLLGVLGVSVFCAACVRWPWKRHQAGFVVTYAGLLVLLSGFIVTLWRGVEGQVVLLEGASTDQLTLSQRSQIMAYWMDRPHDPPYVFTFESGPVHWNPGAKLDIGCVDGLSARVLSYYRRSQPIENWVPSDGGHGGPLMRFQLEVPHGGGRIEHFLVDSDYGAEGFIGPIAIRLQRAISDAMLADFLHPPERDLGEKGALTIYYEDHVQRASVDEHVGQAIAVGDSGVQVELVRYLTNAKLDAAGQFQPLGEDLRNPLVELKVRLPGDDQPYRQVAFAKSPLLNFDGVYERDCPVRFVYQHPKIEPATAIEFLQAGDDKLYCRTIASGKYQSYGEATTDSRFVIQGGFAFTVAEYLPHARRAVSFKPVEFTADEDPSREPAAAEVEVAVGGVTETVWLRRNDPEFQFATINTPEGPLRVQFTTAQLPLGFSLELIDFKREMNPGQVGNVAYSSVVRLIDKERHIDDERLISMNQPLSHNGLRFYQSRFRDAGHGKEASVFSVAYDPGRPLKYTGSLLVCLGIVTVFYIKAVHPRLRVDTLQPHGAAPPERAFIANPPRG